MNKRNSVIIAAMRSPQGRFMGALKDYTAVDLAVEVGHALNKKVPLGKVDQVIMGNVIAAGQGMNMSRQVSLRLGIPEIIPAFSVNMMCASGLKSVMLGAQAIQLGEAQLVLCGGSESMSNAPYLIPKHRSGHKLGNSQLVDALVWDGLTDPLSGEHMGLTAERLALEEGIGREDQDRFALESQRKYREAEKNGVFDSQRVAFPELSEDENPYKDVTLEALKKLQTVFEKKEGTITAGNASGINDGAALLVLCEEEYAHKKGWEPMARIEEFSQIGCDPLRMGLGPVAATRMLCRRLECGPGDFDTVELNEAFAAQAIACVRELGLDEEKVNAHGGAIALGHPIGASGARLIVHLAHQIHQGTISRGLATLCVGGGMGLAMSVSSPI